MAMTRGGIAERLAPNQGGFWPCGMSPGFTYGRGPTSWCSGAGGTVYASDSPLFLPRTLQALGSRGVSISAPSRSVRSQLSRSGYLTASRAS